MAVAGTAVGRVTVVVAVAVAKMCNVVVAAVDDEAVADWAAACGMDGADAVAAGAAATVGAGVVAAATGVAAEAGEGGMLRMPDRLSVDVDAFTPPLLLPLALPLEPALPPLVLAPLMPSNPPSSRYGGGDGDGPGGMNTEKDTEYEEEGEEAGGKRLEKARDAELGERGEGGESLLDEDGVGDTGDRRPLPRKVGMVGADVTGGDDGAKARGDMAEKVVLDEAESGDAIGNDEVMRPARGEAGKSALTTDNNASRPPEPGDDARPSMPLPEPLGYVLVRGEYMDEVAEDARKDAEADWRGDDGGGGDCRINFMLAADGDAIPMLPLPFIAADGTRGLASGPDIGLKAWVPAALGCECGCACDCE